MTRGCWEVLLCARHGDLFCVRSEPEVVLALAVAIRAFTLALGPMTYVCF